MYRYRDHSGGVTRVSLERLHHLDQIGTPLRVRGYRFKSTRKHSWEGKDFLSTAVHEAVLVIGTEGTCRFEGFLWGYGGEGPNGLVQLLKRLGVKEDQARMLADNQRKYPDLGTDWEFIIPARYRKQAA